MSNIKKLSIATTSFDKMASVDMVESNEMVEDSVVSCIPGNSQFCVGLKRSIEELKVPLLERDVSVVHVHCIGGGGKTTLARALCNDPQIKGYFKNVIFITISQSPDLKVILETMWVKILKRNKVKFQNIEDGHMQLQQHLLMQSEPTLIILDDVWSKEDLDKLLFEGTRYKTLITSRDSSIIPKTFSTEVYQLPLLDEQDALSLLCFWAFGQTSIPSTIDANLVKEVQEECGGLPLALKVIGSSLKGKTHVAWERANSKISNGEIISQYYEEGILRCLESSIDSLDDVVKDCFLDLGLFPKGRKICVDALLQIWVNIRKIKWQDAVDILFELAGRNLINLSSNQRIKRTLPYGNALELNFFQHDVMRDLSLYLGCKDNVEHRKRLLMPRREHGIPEKWKLYSNIAFNAQVVSIHTGPMEESQWHEMLFPKAEVLVLLFNASEYFLPPFVKTMKNLKIIMVFNSSSKRAILKGLDALSSLNQLKVVHLEKLISIPNESSKNILDNLENLSLSLCKGIENTPNFNSTKIRSFNLDHCSDLEVLPSSIFHMPNAQLWSLTNCHLVQNISHSIGNLLNLRVLRLSAMPGLKELPTSIGELGLLEYLDISLCEHLRELPEEIGKLKKLIELDMRECSSLKRLPKAVCQLSSLKHVMCDEKIGKQWLQAKRISIPILEVEITKLHFSLDWLDD